MEEKQKESLFTPRSTVIFLIIRSAQIILRSWMKNLQTTGMVAKARAIGRKSISDEKDIEIVAIVCSE